MFWFAALIALAGCGRFGFEVVASQTDSGSGNADSATDVVPLGHDEDGDGIPDVSDLCPHVVDDQLDADADGVGDVCDPDPSLPNQIALFATMGPGDQPFTVGGFTDFDVTQLPDALRFDGALGADNNLYGNLQIPMVLGDARVALGIEVIAIVLGSANNQNQIALAVGDQAPNHFTEINQRPGMYDFAGITFYDGTNYTPADSRDLASGFHPGALFFQTTWRVNTGVAFEVGWPGEMYTLAVSDMVYQGGVRIEMNMNNVHFEIRWLVVITPQ